MPSGTMASSPGPRIRSQAPTRRTSSPAMTRTRVVCSRCMRIAPGAGPSVSNVSSEPWVTTAAAERGDPAFEYMPEWSDIAPRRLRGPSPGFEVRVTPPHGGRSVQQRLEGDQRGADRDDDERPQHRRPDAGPGE